MNRVLGLARAGIALAVVWPSCDGQFDFDTQVLDSGVHAVDGDSNQEDAGFDASADRSRKDIHIACGNEISCDVSGCCSTSSGLACRDIAGGETCSGLLVQCDDSDDCAEGSVCCAEGEAKDDRQCPDASCPIERVQRVHCEPAAHCAMLHYVVLCNPDRPDTCTNCVASTLSGLPPGYHQCADSP